MLVMITVAELDERIDQVDAWVPRAAEALLSFWQSDKGVLVPDSLALDEDGVDEEDELEKTAVRALWALVDYLRWAREESGSDKALGPSQEAARCVNQVAQRWFATLPNSDDYSGASHLNVLTESYRLSCVALLDALYHTADWKPDSDAVANMHHYASECVAKPLITSLAEFRGGKVDADDEVHDFVTLHAIRALDSLYDRVPDNIWEAGPGKLYTPNMLQLLADRAREDVLRQLGYRQAGIASRFDPAELTFSAVLLSRLAPADVVQLIQPALRTALESQTEDGAWPAVRMVDVPSTEVALALLAALARDVQDGRFDFAGELLPKLDRALDLVMATYTVDGRRHGWTNDRARWTGRVGRWPTARVLSFTVRYAGSLRALRQRLVLGQYGAEEPSSRIQWPDLEPTYRVSPSVAEEALRSYSDPTEDAQLTARLQTEVLKPITDGLVQRPEIASLILHGPPGTRKTSLVRMLAGALGWPLLILSPPKFLSRGGLDGFEAAADFVFDDLMRLRRVVVLFDECEEFFLKRPDAESAEQPGSLQSRTLGAFITAGMLPRLQALRDQRWVLFVLATNHKLEALDRAVTRPGRFDYAVLIDHPVLDAQRRYVTAKRLDDEPEKALLTALAKYDQRRRGERPPVSFAALDSVARQLRSLAADMNHTPEAVYQELKRLAENSGPRPLYRQD